MNNLVLIGSPISRSFLREIASNEGIQKTMIIDLRYRGDMLYAGMPHKDLIASTPVLIKQMFQDNGHFYYAPSSAIGHQRRNALANALYAEGLR